VARPEGVNVEIAVLLKAVPRLETVRVDPQRHTLVREGSELLANPFDARAVRVALDLRRTGDGVTVVSMGPPAAAGPLRDALSLGANRAVLVSDPRLAGSDTLVTARVLARVLARSPAASLVLAGQWTTDSETGQVGPEVAELLEFAFATSARRIERHADDSELVVTSDTERGRAEVRLRPPALVGVGEKIAKPGKPSPEDRERARGQPIESLTLDDLRIPASQAGLDGSPTRVVAVRDAQPERTPRVLLREGTAEERARAAAAEVQARLRSRRPSATAPTRRAPPSPSSPTEDGEEPSETLVLVTDETGRVEADALAILAELRRAESVPPPSAVWAGPRPSSRDRETVARSGARRGYVLRAATSGPISARAPARGVERWLSLRPRIAAAVFLSDAHGREVAGRLAARLGAGLTGDAIGLHARASSGEIVWSKPAFGGGMVADIVSRTRPSLATVRPGAFDPPTSDEAAVFRGSDSGVFVWAVAPLPDVADGISRREVLEPADGEWGDLDRARAVIGVGMGLGGPERLEELRPALRAWNAALAGTRRVVDAGWLPVRRQVGLTGRNLSPDLAVLLGVSGSANHLIGWRRARVLAAVDVREDAPIFRSVDVGIVGKWEEIVPPLVPALARVLRGDAPASPS
jgi:electron transfer flavoprotein alpha subunit